MTKDSRMAVSIQALLITAGRRFTVEVGQQIMVVSGIAIGVYTGSEAIPVKPTALLEAPKKPYQKRPGRQTKRSAEVGMPSKDDVSIEIIRRIRNDKQITPAQLQTIFHIGTRDTDYWRIRDAIAALRRDNVLSSIGSGSAVQYIAGPAFPHESSTESAA